MTCSLLAYADTRGVCSVCAAPVTSGRWCSDDCQRFYRRNHYWGAARRNALARDEHSCIDCGYTDDDVFAEGEQYVLYTRSLLLNGHEDNWLEVNHVTPRLGRGYGPGCHNHLSNLETLCHRCHVKVTRRQRVQQARLAG